MATLQMKNKTNKTKRCYVEGFSLKLCDTQRYEAMALTELSNWLETKYKNKGEQES